MGMLGGEEDCSPHAPITPPQELERLQRGELPPPKSLQQEFEQHGDCSPRSPLAASGSSGTQLHIKPQAMPASGDSDGGGSGRDGGSGAAPACASNASSSADAAGSSAAAATMAAAPAADESARRVKWRQSSHDSEEEILQDNSERFCLLPVK